MPFQNSPLAFDAPVIAEKIEYGDWLARRQKIRVSVGSQAPFYEVTLGLYSGPQELYDYLPFNVHVGHHGGHGEIVEVDAPNKSFTARFLIRSEQSGCIEFDFVSDLACVPAERGLGGDTRELSLILSTIAVSPREDRASATAPHAPRSEEPARFADTGEPVFVIGCYRSGTSIMTWAVGQHPNIYPLDETGWLYSGLLSQAACYEVAANRTSSAPQIYDVSRSEFLQLHAASINRLHLAISAERAERDLFKRMRGAAPEFDPRFQISRAPRAQKRRWVDGTPENAGAARLIADAFPRGKFLIMVRDPMEVIRSLGHFERAGGQPQSRAEALQTWLRLTALSIDVARYVGRERAMIVSFERLREPDALMRDCMAFLNEPYFAPCASVFARRINSSSVEEIELQGPEGAELDAVALYERIRLGDLPQVGDFGIPWLTDVDAFHADQERSIMRVFGVVNAQEQPAAKESQPSEEPTQTSPIAPAETLQTIPIVAVPVLNGKPPVLIHYRLDRVVGDVIDRRLAASFGEGWKLLSGPEEGRVKSSDDLRSFLEANQTLKAFTLNEARPPFPTADALPIIVFRHPVDRARSLYEQARSDSRRPDHALASVATFREYIEWALSAPGAGVFLRNYQVIHLSNASRRNARIERATATPLDLESVKDMLATWPAFGIASWLEESFRRFEEAYAPHFPELDFALKPSPETSMPAISDENAMAIAKEDLGEDVFERFLELNRLDSDLYEHARMAFKAY